MYRLLTLFAFTFICLSFLHSDILESIYNISNPELVCSYDRYNSTLLSYQGRLFSTNLCSIEEFLIQDDGTIQRISFIDKREGSTKAFIDEDKYYYIDFISGRDIAYLHCFDIARSPMMFITSIELSIDYQSTHTLFFSDEHIMISDYARHRTILLNKSTYQNDGYINGLYGEYINLQDNIVVQPMSLSGCTILSINTIDINYQLTEISLVTLPDYLGTGINDITYQNQKAILSMQLGLVIVDYNDIFNPYIFCSILSDYGYTTGYLAGEYLFTYENTSHFKVYQLQNSGQATLLYVEDSIPTQDVISNGTICYVEPYLYVNAGYYIIIYNISNSINIIDTLGNSRIGYVGISLDDNELYFMVINHREQSQSIYSALDNALLCHLYYDTFYPALVDVFIVKNGYLYVNHRDGTSRSLDMFSLQNQQATLVDSIPIAYSPSGNMNLIRNYLFTYIYNENNTNPYRTAVYSVNDASLTYITEFVGSMPFSYYGSDSQDYVIYSQNNRMTIRDASNINDIIFDVPFPSGILENDGPMPYDYNHVVRFTDSLTQVNAFSLDNQQFSTLNPTINGGYANVHNKVIAINGLYGEPSRYYTVYGNQISMVGSKTFDRDNHRTFFFPQRNKMVQVAQNGIWVYDFLYTLSETDETIPSVETLLLQNYPNPFNPDTTISFLLEKTSFVNLDVFNVKGQLVKVLVANYKTAGKHHILWNGVDNQGIPVTSGVYLYRLKIDNYTQTKKMVLLR